MAKGYTKGKGGGKGGGRAGRSVKDIGAAEQNIINSPIEVAFGYDKDGNVVIDKNGTSSSVEFTLDELALLKNGTLTHNHPKGNSFSLEDILVMHEHGLKEIRAIGVNSLGEKVLHIMRPGALVSKAQITRSFQNATREVTRRFEQSINMGQMSLSQANSLHFHSVWTKVAAELGLSYSRRVL